MASFTYRGLIAPVFTPFDDNMDPNLDVIETYAKYLKKHGIQGVLVNGTSGEGPSLTINERKNIAEKWKSVVSETQQHLMVQVGGAAFPHVIELAKHAEEIGADSILCLPDLFFQPNTVADLIEYLRRVAAAAPKTPLLYYHNPGFTNVELNMEDLIEKIGVEVPTFCGVKFTSAHLYEGQMALSFENRKYAVFLGNDNLLLAAWSMGYDSAIATSFNIFPEYGVGLFNAMKEYNIEMSRAKQDTLNAAIKVIIKDGDWVPTMKHAMNLLTPVKVGRARFPVKNLGEEKVHAMKVALQDLGHGLIEM